MANLLVFCDPPAGNPPAEATNRLAQTIPNYPLSRNRPAKFRVDGFASIDSFGTEGFLRTTNLTFAGTKLKLNVDAGGEDTAGEKNYVRVELLDAAGSVLPGYTQSDCDPIHVDRVDHVVTWGGKSDVSKLAGREISVKLYLKGAEVYALQFVE